MSGTAPEVRALARVIAGRDLSRGAMETLLGRLMDGELSEAYLAALLAALAAKGESTDELAGAAAAMRRRVIAVASRRDNLVDTCGTGGDGRGTFNVSTAAALIAAAAGVAIAKHGNRAVSSRSGSADVLAALGVEIELDAVTAGRALDELGIAFLFAPRLHPAMRVVAPVRQALGVRTMFNVLGPLTNPARARRQVLGVFAPGLVERLARVLVELGSERALVVHGSDGLDEITTTGPTGVAEVRRGEVRSWELDPGDLGIAAARPEDLVGGDPAENAATMRALLDGERGPIYDIATLNAAAAIWIGGRADGLAHGLEVARRAVDTGAARSKLEALVAFGRGTA